ncbi:MAG: polysaccharide deacetylase family protein [Gammaproteobacteria bacterium]|nr:polysaccharide deacetylase family protein [Gammaproteobacteria bacterium]
MRILLSLLLLVVALPAKAAVVFMYHRVGDGDFPSTNVEIAQFEQHLDFLAERSIPVWPLSRIVSAMQAGEPVPDDVVAITVDDAYLSFYRSGVPLLEKYGIPFTVFVSTNGVDDGLADYMNWDQLRDIMRRGGELANHTASHDYLVRRKEGESEAEWLQRVSTDIGKAQQRLQAELGDEVNATPRLFAWPYGEYTTALANRVKEMGYVAFGQQSGAFDADSDRRALPRFPINENYSSLDDFRLKARTLAMPVVSVDPWNPVVESATPPRMTIKLGESQLQPGSLACYFGAQQLDPDWSSMFTEFSVQGEGALSQGRSRYNCTARHKESGRYYWYSHLWIR